MAASGASRCSRCRWLKDWSAPSLYREHVVRAHEATTRNPLDDPLFEPGMDSAFRAREKARIDVLIAWADANLHPYQRGA